jgi:hypothetical protein
MCFYYLGKQSCELEKRCSTQARTCWCLVEMTSWEVCGGVASLYLAVLSVGADSYVRSRTPLELRDWLVPAVVCPECSCEVTTAVIQSLIHCD